MESEETIKVRRVAEERLLSAHVVFMAAFGLLGWMALLSTSFASGIGTRPVSALAWVVFLVVIAGARLLAFRMLPETPVSLDSAYYIAAVLCLGALAAGWIVAAALTFDALLRLVGVEPAARRMRDARVAHEGKVLRVTASLGISCYLDGAGKKPGAAADDVATLVERADVALYRAKTSGKNRVELYWGEPEAAFYQQGSR